MNFVPCLTWVAKGIAKSLPDIVQLSPEEMKRLIEETKDSSSTKTEVKDKSSIEVEDENSLEVEDENSSEVEDENSSEVEDENSSEDEDFDLENKKSSQEYDTKEEENEIDFESKYNLQFYDDEDEDQTFINISDVATFVDNKDDNYITDYEAVVDDDNEDNEDFIIKNTDNLLLVGHIEEDSSVLEVYVYNKEDDDLYVHHDIVLPAYPLALEWLDFHPAEDTIANYVAVGDMTPIIKIWDLDTVDVLEPDYSLGKTIKENKLEKIKLKYHIDAVLSLSWNKHVRNILASGSADSSIVIWDLQIGKPLNKFEYHTNKVQSLQWHPYESSFLLSGCTDGIVKLYDCRVPDKECKSWTIGGEIEKVAWNLLDPIKFLCSTDQGFVHCINMRTDKIEHSVKAHSEAVTGLDVCPTKPNILITASMDKTIKIWDLEKLNFIKSQKLKVGSIYTAKFAPDSGLTLAIGGNERSHSLKVLDLEEKLSTVEDDLQNSTPVLKSGKKINKVKKKILKNNSSGTKDFKKTSQNHFKQSNDLPSWKRTTKKCDSKCPPVKKIKKEKA